MVVGVALERIGEERVMGQGGRVGGRGRLDGQRLVDPKHRQILDGRRGRRRGSDSVEMGTGPRWRAEQTGLGGRGAMVGADVAPSDGPDRARGCPIELATDHRLGRLSHRRLRLDLRRHIQSLDLLLSPQL
jgi:hypothetical protein